MSSGFSQNVIKEINKFRANPKYIQHQCELIHKGISRLKGNDSFLKEIEAFIKQLETMKPLGELKYNQELSEAAKKELPNFRGRENYQKYKKGNSLKGIVPDHYLEAVPALIADDGADQPINVVTKILLNRFDKAKEGRSILCDPKYTQVGVAQEEFKEENMVIIILSTKFMEYNPIKTSKNEFILNIQYHETKDIKKPKFQAYVYHRIKGDIFGGENFEKTSFQKAIYTQGGNRPKLEQKEEDQGRKLRANKSEARIKTKTAREKAPTTSSAKNEKIQETSLKRRNEGTSSKTETRTQTKTTSSGIRGQPKETSSVTSKTTTTRTTGGRLGNTKNEVTKQTTTTTTTTSNTGENGGASFREKYSKRKRF